MEAESLKPRCWWAGSSEGFEDGIYSWTLFGMWVAILPLYLFISSSLCVCYFHIQFLLFIRLPVILNYESSLLEYDLILNDKINFQLITSVMTLYLNEVTL